MNLPPNQAPAALGQRTFRSQGSVVFQAPRMEFSGRFDQAGEPILEQRLYWDTAPIAQCQPGQEFKGILIAYTPPRDNRIYAIIETSTIPLAFPFSSSTSVVSNLAVGSPVSVGLDVSERNQMRSSLSDPSAESLKPLLDEPITIAPGQKIAESQHRLAMEEAPSVDEVVWLRARLSQLSVREDVPLAEQEAHQAACHLVLGEAYRKALIREHSASQDLKRWESHVETSLVKPGDYHLEPLHRRRQESFQELSRCREQVRTLWSALEHPRLQSIVDQTARKLMRQQDAIQDRLAMFEPKERPMQRPHNKLSISPQLRIKPAGNPARRMKL